MKPPIAKVAPHTAQSIIEDREASHGDYTVQARMAQLLKVQMRSSPGWGKLEADQQESLEMLAVKISRVLTGSPNVADHWLDMAGYATLVHNRLTKGTHL